MADDGLSFGRFRYEPAQAILFCSGKPVALGRRGILILDALLLRRGDVIEKATLLEAAWPGEIVEEANLSVQVSQLRRKIGSGWIRTVERVGYQFVAEHSVGIQPAPTRRTPVVVVSPFLQFDEQAGPGTLTLGLTEDLTTALAKITWLCVLAPERKEEGQKLRLGRQAGVDYRVEGSIRRLGERLRIVVRLLDEPEGGTCLWADTIEALASNIETLDRIVRSLAAIINLQVQRAEIMRSTRDRPQSGDAYDLYLRGLKKLHTGRPEDNIVAGRLFTAALDLEPENVTFLAAICETLAGQRIPMGWPLGNEDWELCREYTERGLRQNTTDADALGSFGMSAFRTVDPAFGLWQARRAVEINPASVMALVVAANIEFEWGVPANARAYAYRAIKLSPHDPLQRFSLSVLGGLERLSGNFEAALVWANRAYGVHQHYAAIHWALIAAPAHLGQMVVARRSLDRYLAIHPGSTISAIAARREQSGGRYDNLFEGLRRAGLPDY